MVLTKSSQELYEEYRNRMQKIADVRYSAAVLQWDQETYLPQKGAGFRGQQLATLAEIAHEWATEPSLGDLLVELNTRTDLADDEKRNLQLNLEDYNKQKKFTPAFIRLISETTSRSFHSWIQARNANSFSLFKDDLERLVALKKQEAELAGYEGHPYNALLDQYEKGATTTLLDKTFDGILTPLKQLLDRISSQPQVNDD